MFVVTSGSRLSEPLIRHLYRRHDRCRYSLIINRRGGIDSAPPVLFLYKQKRLYTLSCSLILFQAPFKAVLGVLDIEAYGGQTVTDQVAGGPVLLGFGL